VRLNQVGYVTGCSKLALVMSQRPLGAAAFTVVDATGQHALVRGALGPSRGSWNATWRYVYPLDFSALHNAGRFTIEVAGASAPVVVDPALVLYRRLTGNALRFFQAQRDGAGVIPGALGRRPSHLRDAHAAVYQQPTYSDLMLLGGLTPAGGFVDASGGWFDAGDYLKFVETTSFSEVLQLLTLRDYKQSVAKRAALTREARFGLQWLMRMWDGRRGVLYYQVGIGDGNGSTILGDHDAWRLPEADDRSRARPGQASYFIANRPAFAANRPGGLISPNLAGRLAGAFALCAQVFLETDPGLANSCLNNADAIYARADTHPAQLLSTSPHAYYGDTQWFDDMELGAVELYLGARALGGDDGTRANRYLNQAGQWANAYASSAADGQDTLNLYDVSALAHYDLVRVLRDPAVVLALQRVPSVNVATDQRSLLKDISDQLSLGTRVGMGDPFRLSNVAGNTDTVQHALGVVIEANLYDQLSKTSTFDSLAATQLDWLLGDNPWGSSFVVGAGTQFPHCLADQVANLSGSLDGRPPLLLGATVNGPVDPATLLGRGAPDGFRRCPSAGGNPYATFDTPRIAYLDDVTSATTSEPSIDSAALSLLAFTQATQRGSSAA
jgi:hypothetical protein